MLLSSEPALSTKVLFLQDDSAALTLTLRAAPHPCLVNRGMQRPHLLRSVGQAGEGLTCSHCSEVCFLVPV